jgi:OOP family OmpA-OmpF porin
MFPGAVLGDALPIGDELGYGGPDFEALGTLYLNFGEVAGSRTIVRKEVTVVTPADPDGDGIAGASDRCPNVAEDRDGFQDEDGCPDPDNDGDGVLDATDKCPTEPETKNGFQDEDGCPDEIPAKLKQFTGIIQGINFKLNDATLQPTSNAALDKAVAVLKEFGDLKLEIQGHTDDQALKAGGKFADNQALSQARADSVKAYFVSKGIDEARLTAKGYGDTVPVENPKDLTAGKLNAARAKNRRVEFKLVSALTQ